jgi:hypothetical protein
VTAILGILFAVAVARSLSEWIGTWQGVRRARREADR